MTSPNVFNYLDYRKFLRDYYMERKSQAPTFSYQIFAQKAGFRSKSFLFQIIEGQRSMSKQNLFKITEATGLKGKAFTYFQDLVAFNQAKSIKEKTFYYAKLAEYTRRSEAKTLQTDQYEFFSRWYYGSIREILPLQDFNEDYEALGKALKPAITARQAQNAVQVLLRLGLIRKTEKGYEQINKAITSGDEIQTLAVHNFHLQNLILAGESMDTFGGDERDISCLMVALSPESFATIKSEIKRFRKKVAEIADQTPRPNRIYHVNFQFFPVSKDIAGGKP